MTIAAGLLHRDGVLVCADTELTGAASKTYAAKVRHFECDWGRTGIAYAGHVDNATVVSQKLEAALKPIKKNPLAKIEEVVEAQFRRLVHNSPRPDDAYFELLIVVRPTNEAAQLYVTSDVAVLKVDHYRIIGIGETFGEHLIEPGFTVGMDSQRVLLLAVNALALVKRRVSYCGGPSMYLDLRNDGSILEHYGSPLLERLEKWVGVYHFLSWNLLTHFANQKESDEHFIANLDLFGRHLIEARKSFEDDAKLHQMRADAMRAITQGKA